MNLKSVFALIFTHLVSQAITQCNPYFKSPLSSRPTYYNIDAQLDESTKQIKASQSIQYINQSKVAIHELRFYMYLNAFKNTNSTFLKGTTNIFGQTLANRKSDEWGWIDIQDLYITQKQIQYDLQNKFKYISLDDGNESDQTVLQVELEKEILPGDTATIELNWMAKMPKTIIRAGYNQDFYLFCHWFPQLGVFEESIEGKWQWNCHQFFRATEFYADFGVYDVNITVNKKFIIGASGCLISEQTNKDNTITRKYHAEDVIDFTWAINTDCKVIEDRWRNTQIRILLPNDYSNLTERYRFILKFALEYLDVHVGSYPYPIITVVCPPFHALRSGLMEYPTLITTGSFYKMPTGIRTTESLLVHEFVHQYFMGMVASNEKEEPWLDEGFATYFEDRIIDAAYGKKKSLIDILGFHLDNRELTRSEYTGMKNPSEGIVARPAWEFSQSNHKSLIYSKTASTLHSIQNIIGEDQIDNIIQTYFNKWKFKHPRGQDLMSAFNVELKKMKDTSLAHMTYQLLEQSIYQAHSLDYRVVQISNDLASHSQGIYGI
ncbi:MAG: M1 family metallopeptidase, partial [Saprospiraceae bacterium]